MPAESMVAGRDARPSTEGLVQPFDEKSGHLPGDVTP
jgi:hypothetical protein